MTTSPTRHSAVFRLNIKSNGRHHSRPETLTLIFLTCTNYPSARPTDVPRRSEWSEDSFISCSDNSRRDLKNVS